jgi:hypothetical protein
LRLASREEVYCKFGIAAEAAQLFETDLGTLLLAVKGLDNGWHVHPNPKSARKVADQIDACTLGALLARLKERIVVDEQLEATFSSGLKARNRLMHEFFERHNFKIQSEDGRDLMIADLEGLHEESTRHGNTQVQYHPS